ncbi:hypothetical protein D3C71_2167770 [compost metagenome]
MTSLARYSAESVSMEYWPFLPFTRRVAALRMDSFSSSVMLLTTQGMGFPLLFRNRGDTTISSVTEAVTFWA